MYYNQSTITERTRKLYKLLKQHNLFGIYMTTIAVRPDRIFIILSEWLEMWITPIYHLIEGELRDGTLDNINPKEILMSFNDTLSRLDEEYLVNLIEYMRRYFNSERGKNINLIASNDDY